MGKTAAKAPENVGAVIENGITLTKEEARQLYSLYENVELADAHFHTCQSHQFRQHLQGVYKAENVSRAFAKLAAFLAENE